MTNTNEVGEIVLKAAVNQAQKEFGSRLVACYALGSLAHGGFSPQVSDVDLGIILTSPLVPTDSHQIEEIKNYVKSLKLPLAERLSIFWGSIASLKNEEPGGRFPASDKLDLIEYGRLLAGNEVRQPLFKPTQQELEVSGANYALSVLATPERIEQLLNPSKVLDKGILYFTKTVLFPVRFLYTASTGNIGRNDVAVAHYLENNQDKKAELVELAFRLRGESATNEEEMIKLMQQALIPLYLQFIDTYYANMLDYKELEVAENLQQWRNKLLNKD